MDCKASSALIMSYVDETIKDHEWADLQEHMKSCSKCQEEFQVFTEMLGLIEDIALYEPSSNFEDKVMELIDPSLYATASKKSFALGPIFISIGIYITFAIMFLQEKRAGILGRWVVNGSKTLQQISLLGKLIEKIIEGSYSIFVAFPFKIIQYVIGSLSLNPTNLLLTYGISLGVLVVLLKLIKGTLMELLNIEGGEVRWRKINLEE